MKQKFLDFAFLRSSESDRDTHAMVLSQGDGTEVNTQFLSPDGSLSNGKGSFSRKNIICIPGQSDEATSLPEGISRTETQAWLRISLQMPCRPFGALKNQERQKSQKC